MGHYWKHNKKVKTLNKTKHNKTALKTIGKTRRFHRAAVVIEWMINGRYKKCKIKKRKKNRLNRERKTELRGEHNEEKKKEKC